MHDDDPIDLTPLDPDADPGAEEQFVGAVMSRIAERRNPYPVRVDPLWGAWSLARPVSIAASIAILLAGLLIVRAMVDDRRAPLTVAESLGIPPEFGAGLVTPVSNTGGPR
jgi:hypothetical protein